MPISTDLVPLGTASAIPANGRHLSAFALRREGRMLLFDCGEGTQYRLLEAGLKRSRLNAVFITHFHGDHLYGLPGLLSTMSLLGRKEPLTLVGPVGLQRVLEGLPGLAAGWLPFETRYVEVEEGFTHEVVYEDATCIVEARPLQHRVFTMGFRYTERPRRGRVDAEQVVAMGLEPRQVGMLVRGEEVTTPEGRVVRSEEVIGPERPGLTIAYCLDTEPCEGARQLAEGADLLVHEATFTESFLERASETGHSTARQAAETAREADAERLLLTHFSARYDDVSPLVEEARAVFANTEAAEELKAYRLEPGV